ncbi:MAG: branched-chain amino acid transport system ATP-binding protein [Streptosporangiaceae bacterium]|jgi:branched-chain amino acid transport system ATP-binding protein|nr:livF [Streptosporangiaceae bacterium]MDX6432188.1 branched-chain amino acid transport system ATP-binding protein [Streptosporangiaceae bacterium]
MSTVLECRSLDAGHLGRPVVRGFDLSVSEGEIVALLGPNGAGKTTVLLTLSGLLPKLGGSVSLLGHPLRASRPHLVTRLGLVLVPDDRALFTTLTTRENLRLGRRRGGMGVPEVLSYFPALEERLDVKAGMLSGGEQQMLAVGRALVQGPKVLLLDEMSMGLAPTIVESLLSGLRKIAGDSGVAVVLVEQHVMLALEVADRALVLAHGEVTLQGSAADLAADRERLENSYLGAGARPAGNTASDIVAHMARPA